LEIRAKRDPSQRRNKQTHKPTLPIDEEVSTTMADININDNNDISNEEELETRKDPVLLTPCRTCIHPYELLRLVSSNKNKHKNIDDDLSDCAKAYLEEQSLLQDHCVTTTNSRKQLSCSCMTVFQRIDERQEAPWTDAVAKYMVYFIRKPKQEQQKTVILWIKHSKIARKNPDRTWCIYNIPCLLQSSSNDNEPVEWFLQDAPRICHSALLTILGKGRVFWTTCCKAAATNQLPTHGLRGRPSNRARLFDEAVADDLRIFFEELFANHPTESKTAKNGDAFIEIHGQHEGRQFSQRGLYRLFCFGRGWKVISKDNKGGTNIVIRQPEDGWDSSFQQLPICSWNSFQRFWKENYPTLRVQPHKNSQKQPPFSISYCLINHISW
jgi:hypothetical protein